jgi:hypothetical protein
MCEIMNERLHDSELTTHAQLNESRLSRLVKDQNSRPIKERYQGDTTVQESLEIILVHSKGHPSICNIVLRWGIIFLNLRGGGGACTSVKSDMQCKMMSLKDCCK